MLAATPHVVCHAAYLIERLGYAASASRAAVRAARDQRHLDIAELFAFVAPALPAVPLPDGLARALAVTPGSDDCLTIAAVAEELLARLADPRFGRRRETAELSQFLGRARWPWAEPVLAALRLGDPDLKLPPFATGLNVWDRLPEWEEEGPRPPSRHAAVSADEARTFLAELLGPDAEARPQQMDYCAEAAGAFRPRSEPMSNMILLVEAGTGLGKTLGYLAPAALWARRNAGTVWVSTYTKNLQRQLEQESARIVPEPEERRRRIVIRKGRENYACLLNMQEAFGRMTHSPKSALLAGLIARWAMASRDGDMVGGDFPAWIMGLTSDVVGDPATASPARLGLTDRRGECIYAACPHYRKCFIEKAVRAGRKADIVIANHALVLRQAAIDLALGPAETTEEQEQAGAMRRLVFDEGHHLFDAADSAFSGHLTGAETAELRRWIRGPEAQGRRGRGLADRLGELASDDRASEELLGLVLAAALSLPGPGWMRRVQAGMPDGAAETFLWLVRQQVEARNSPSAAPMVETDCRPLAEGLADAAGRLAAALIDLKRPMSLLAQRLGKRLDEEASELTSAERARIEAMARSLRRRSELMTAGWVAMLARLLEEPDPRFVEWFAIDQAEGREIDFGFHSHWVDPTEPLAAAVLRPPDGIIITSATLRDRPPEAPEDWRNAELRTGAAHLPYAVRRASFPSPFDYRANSCIIVVNDVARDDMDQLAAAYRELFLASGGGGLGLFTAIARLRAVHRRLVVPLARAGLPLYAQHVDPIDTGTLVDMFRAERQSCLLGTDAVRDGVDVPGDSLRLIVLDRVPWSQPTILERARRQQFGGGLWQDMGVRLRLRQAFGRLIRRGDDRGVFVVLDSRLASRFCTAFPEGMTVARMGLVEAIDATSRFLGPPSPHGRA
jgi:ATP-dependent DNA helicase DinG